MTSFKQFKLSSIVGATLLGLSLSPAFAQSGKFYGEELETGRANVDRVYSCSQREKLATVFIRRHGDEVTTTLRLLKNFDTIFRESVEADAYQHYKVFARHFCETGELGVKQLENN